MNYRRYGCHVMSRDGINLDDVDVICYACLFYLLISSVYLICMYLFCFVFFFFFSSRRRHTRCSRDWSSDVCSSDLRESQMVADIDQALMRIEEGSYGQCVRCSKPIDERRLEALPTARYDATCQEIGRASCRERV